MSEACAPLAYAPLGLYVHWPFCKAKCPYCDFNSHVSNSVDFNGFEQGLLRELTYLAGRLPCKPKLHSIFFGGGTPSLMPARIVAAIIDSAQAIFGFENNIEITAEANPTSVEIDNLSAFKAAGVNRISLGIQALDDNLLRFLGRTHSASDALTALERARGIFDRLSIDLIYGLPQQSIKDWQSNMQQVLALGLDHLSLYQLTIEPGTTFHTYAQKGTVLTGSDAVVATQFELTNMMTAEAGLVAYEVSNYARAGQECRHNLIYWRAQNWIGIGPGAHSRFDDSQRRIGLATRRSPSGWLEMTRDCGHGIEKDFYEAAADCAAEAVMMGLRLTEGINLHTLEQKFGPCDQWLDGKMLKRHEDNGLLFQNEAGALATTAQGRLFLNSILADILK